MKGASNDKQADFIDAFNTTCTSRYLDDILNINHIHFGNIVCPRYCCLKLQINKANTFDTKAAFLHLHLSILMILFLPKFTMKVTI